MYLPNDFLPHDRDYYIKVFVFDIDDQVFISYPSHTQGYRFKATKNEYDPDVITIEPTYIVVSYYEKDRKKIPGDYRDYRPCTVRFEQIGLLNSFDKMKENLGAKNLSSQNYTPELDKISEKLSLKLPEADNELKLCIMYDENGAHGYNKLRDLAGLGYNNDTFYETLVVCLQNKENNGTVYGFKYVSQLREVLKALDEAVYGLAYNGPVYDQPTLAESYKRKFWQQVETEIDKLNYEFVKLSERATAINPKNEKAKGAYHVVLKSAGAKKLVVIKLIQEILRCDLNKAKHLADTAQETVKAYENEDEAYALKAKLEAAGAKAEVIFYYYIND
jgi:ribosomal protein L7/L12